MTKQFVELTCPRCGGELKGDGGLFVCLHCERRWERETIDDYEKIFEKFDVALREQRMEDLAALTRRRYAEAHKEFVSNEELERICKKILDLNPDDFYAQFYLATCKEDYSLEEFLSSLNIARHYYDIEDMLNYLIRGLQARWINAVSTLIENAYKSRDINKYDNYRTRFEKMADNVDNGIFEPTLPRDIFIAYSSSDMKKVNELLRVLEEENGLSCFVAARNLRHGSGAVENYREAIKTAINNCNTVVFVSSENSRNNRCEAMSELNYIKDNLPKMGRIELLASAYKGNAIERVFTRFFNGLEYCTSAQEVAERYVDNYMFDDTEEDSEAERIAREKAEAEEAKRRFEEETRQKLEAEFAAKLKAEAEAKRKAEAEAEAKRKAEAEAEAEARRRAEAEAEARRRAEAEAKRKAEAEAEAEAKRRAEAASPLSDFEIENGVLKKYKGNSENVVIPNSVTSIGEKAFYKCKGIASIEIPNSVTRIGYEAFRDCSSLTSIEIPNSVTRIGKGAFAGCSSLESIMVDKSNTVYHSAGNCLIETKSKTLIAGCKNSTIPTDGSVTSIGGSAFAGCSSLTSINIPNSVTSIGVCAFSSCSSLTSINIPNSVTSIGEWAFVSCRSLKNIYCKVRIKPWGWNREWLGRCNAKVIWGYKG